MVIPMFLAVPSIIGMTDSILVALVSGSLVLAISATWARVTLPTLSLLGLPEPDSMPEQAGSEKTCQVRSDLPCSCALVCRQRLPVRRCVGVA